MTKEERVAQRHENIETTSKLLEVARGYDALDAVCNEKMAEIRRLNAAIAMKMPRRFHPLLVLILGLITCGIFWIICLILFLVDKYKWKKRRQKLEAELAVAKEEYRLACEARETYDNDVYKPHIATLIPDRFAAKYVRNTYAIEFVLDTLYNLCADTMREAFLYFEEAQHRARLESVLGLVAANTADTARSAARTAAATEDTARNTAVIAANTAATAAAATSTAASAASIADSAADVAASERRMADSVDNALR